MFVAERYSGSEILNVGVGTDISIAEFATKIAETVGYRGSIVFDPAKPDGTPRRLLDISRMTALGWNARTGLDEGLRLYYQSYRSEMAVGEWC